LHGFGEYAMMYRHVCETFAGAGYACAIYDQRGHGEMPEVDRAKRKKRLGVLKDYGLFLDDVEAAKNKISELYPGVPLILYGHSMGGNIAANYAIKNAEGGFAKLILEAPWLRLKTPKPRALVFASRALGKVSHKLAVRDKLVLEILTHDETVVEAMRNDTTYHNRISFKIFAQLTDAGEYAIFNADKIYVKTLVLCSGNDLVVCPDAEREFARKASAELYEDKNAFHALHNEAEPSRQSAFDAMLEFLRARD